MYSNKDNINILINLLIQFGVKYAVLCPGSRNSPIVHNIIETKKFSCIPVTDERAAAFVAIGLSSINSTPIVICVTSGSALLDTAPAIAEAYYRNLPIILISADRPPQWIGQTDGQTINQVDALKNYVKKSINLIEPKNTEEKWFCNRLVNEALITATTYGAGPIHINVPISEPLFDYSLKELPQQRKITFFEAIPNVIVQQHTVEKFSKAKRPILIIGQLNLEEAKDIANIVDKIKLTYTVIAERTANLNGYQNTYIDEAIINIGNDKKYYPDFIIYIGKAIISKRLKKFLRDSKPKDCIVVDKNGEIRDTFMTATEVHQSSNKKFLEAIAHTITNNKKQNSYYNIWNKLLTNIEKRAKTFKPDFSQMLAVKLLNKSFKKQQNIFTIYSNSSPIRLANIYAKSIIINNRGVNGIEGTISTAIGVAKYINNKFPVYCIIGDLSFFYDQNALWIQNYPNNLHIILLNNKGGGIFHQLAGLNSSPYRDKFISGQHIYTAKDICKNYNIKYFKATNEEELLNELKKLEKINDQASILEVITDSDKDANVIKEYYKLFEKI